MFVQNCLSRLQDKIMEYRNQGQGVQPWTATWWSTLFIVCSRLSASSRSCGVSSCTQAGVRWPMMWTPTLRIHCSFAFTVGGHGLVLFVGDFDIRVDFNTLPRKGYQGHILHTWLSPFAKSRIFKESLAPLLLDGRSRRQIAWQWATSLK